MTTSYTYKPEELTRYVVDLLEQHKTDFDPSVVAVYYGDQTIIPDTPTICVEPATLARTYAGVPYQTSNEFSLTAIVYHAALDDVESIQEVCDKLTTQVADFLNTQGTPHAYGLGGDQFGERIVSAAVVEYEYGYSMRENTLLRANRITLTAMSKTRIVEAPQ